MNMKSIRRIVRIFLAVAGMLVTTTLSAQVTVKGTVADDKGEALPGVTVVVTNTTSGVVTDSKGAFSIPVPRIGDVLEFSLVGYSTEQRQIRQADAGTPMKVMLHEASQYLDEVVVIGYGEVRRQDFTGSVGKVDMEDLLKVPAASFDQAMAGRVAGVQVTSNEGTPGAAMNIVVRGKNSLTQDNSPLYVVDGFPMEDATIGSSLNPNDIASIDILKDASATAIYGARGANGVVIITTKKGESGKLRINYDYTAGVQDITKQMDMMDAYEFVKLQAEVYTPQEMLTMGYFQNYNGMQYDLEDYRDIPQIDWQDKIFRTAWMHNHNLSATGGGENVKYSMSFSMYDQDGVVINSNFNKVQGRINLGFSRNKFSANVTANYTKECSSGNSPSQSNSLGQYNIFYNVWGYRPVNKPNERLSELLDTITDDTEGVNKLTDYRYNPYLQLNNEYNKRYRANLYFSAWAEYELLAGLKIRSSFGYSNNNRRNEYFNNSKTLGGRPGNSNGLNGGISVFDSDFFLNENTVTYSTKIKKHFMSFLGGFTLQTSQAKTNSYATKNIPSAYEMQRMNALKYGVESSFNNSIDETGMMSFLGRANYNYNGTYFFTVNFRADGSSKFDKQNRWGYFPSFSTAWVISRERFFEALRPAVYSAKLRAGWGQTGNNRVGSYDRFALYDMLKRGVGDYASATGYTHGVYPIGGNILDAEGVVPIRLGNDQLKWETTDQVDVGLDLAFLKDRLNLVVDWYYKKTKDLLFFTEIPLSSGYGGAMRNIGDNENTGIEFTLNTVNIRTRKFEWTSSFNIAFNRNKVLRLAEGVNSKLTTAPFDNNFNQNNYIAKVGYPMGMMYGYAYEGTYKYEDFNYVSGQYILKPGIAKYVGEANPQPGYAKLKDINGDGVVDGNDMTIIGRGDPLNIGGFTNNLRFKGFDLNIFLQWSYGNDILNANKLLFESGYNKRRELNQFASFADRWTPENPYSDIPRSSTSALNNLFTSRLIEDGSYLRIKNISLGYTLPVSLVKKAGLSNVRIFASVQNLYTFTNYSGYDPEVSIRDTALTPGMDFSAYPRARTFSFGVNLQF